MEHARPTLSLPTLIADRPVHYPLFPPLVLSIKLLKFHCIFCGLFSRPVISPVLRLDRLSCLPLSPPPAGAGPWTGFIHNCPYSTCQAAGLLCTTPATSVGEFSPPSWCKRFLETLGVDLLGADHPAPFCCSWEWGYTQPWPSRLQMAPFADKHLWRFSTAEDWGLVPCLRLCPSFMVAQTVVAWASQLQPQLPAPTELGETWTRSLDPCFISGTHVINKAVGSHLSFSTSAMGNKPWNNTSPTSPLGCLLETLKPLRLMPYLKTRELICLCTKKWPKYPLHNNLKWWLLRPQFYGNFLISAR